MTIDPAPRVDGRAFLRCLCGRLPTRDDLDVGLHVRERVADTDVRIPGAVNANCGDLDPVAAVVGLDQQSFPGGAAGSIAHSGQSLSRLVSDSSGGATMTNARPHRPQT